MKPAPNSGSDDSVLVALKTIETLERNLTSFLTVLGLDGTILLPETRIPGGNKFEGIAVLPLDAREVKHWDHRKHLI